jgi:hypothetical protein
VLTNSGTKVPNVDLVEIGPSYDFTLQRSKLASDELYKESKKQPKEIQVKIEILFYEHKKGLNVKTNPFSQLKAKEKEEY